MNVLIADDDTDILEIIDHMWRENIPETNKTFFAKNAQEAIEILNNNKIDMCISDHNMPGGNGNEVLKYIIFNNLNINFVLCSTVTAKENPLKYPNEKVLFHIEKPDIENGIKALAKILAVARKYRQSIEVKTNAIKKIA